MLQLMRGTLILCSWKMKDSYSVESSLFYFILFYLPIDHNDPAILDGGLVLFSFLMSRQMKKWGFGADGLMVSRGSRWLQHEDVSKLTNIICLYLQLKKVY